MLYELKELLRYGTNDGYIIKALRFINENLDRSISLSDVSRHLNISREYTATLFKRKTGQTVTAYIQERKMQLAKEKIKYSTETLCDIASALGYENYNYFSRTFKKHFELSPAQYKANFRN